MTAHFQTPALRWTICCSNPGKGRRFSLLHPRPDRP